MIDFLYNIYKSHPIICTDTRAITNNSLFFALKGESFDGNTFAEKALNLGAAYAVIDNATYKVDERCILVNNVLKTLQKLALHHRKQLQIPFIGITGTNGKTTTKELMHAVLSQRYNCIATKGNLNNHIGVPLSILSVFPETEIAIIEMGANHQHEIEQLCQIALPNYGIVTNIGKAHLEGFGGYEGVIKAKSELYHFIKQSNGYLFVNSDNALLMALSCNCNRILYGSSENTFYRGENINSSVYLEFLFENEKIETQIVGSYNFENTMAAVSVGKHFGVSVQQIKEALKNYIPSNSRSQQVKTQHNTLIVDCYNANPSSVKAALENFSSLNSPNKALFLGGMRELGSESQKEHEAIYNFILEKQFEKVVLVGNEFKFASQKEDAVLWFPDSLKAQTYFKNHPLQNYTILLKGSRGIAMEKMIDIF